MYINTVKQEEDTVYKHLNKQENARNIVIFTVLWGGAAHAFSYFNLSYNHDSLMICSTDANWQISLGRYLQPAYLLLRQPANVPWLVGLLSLIYLAAGIYFIADMFSITDTTQLLALTGVLATNVTLICLNAVYIPWADIFMLSFFFSVLGVWLVAHEKYGWKLRILLGGCALAISMALYQSYLAVYVTLSMILAIQMLVRHKRIKAVVVESIHLIIGAIIGAGKYYLGMQIALRLTGVTLSSYKGLSDVGNFSDVSIIELLKTTYSYYFSAFFGGTLWPAVIAANALLLMISLVGLFCLQNLGWQIYGLLAIIAAMLPFGSNLICFISKGAVYELMTFSFPLVYLLTILLWPALKSGRLFKKHYRKIYIASILCVAILTFSNIIIANQTYLKKKLVYDSTSSMITRILYSMESTEGYNAGDTPVCLVGSLEYNPYCQNYIDFGEAEKITLGKPDVSVTYEGTYRDWFEYVENANIKWIQPETPEADALPQEKIEAMPAFPQRGYCQMVNDALVVKLSDKFNG